MFNMMNAMRIEVGLGAACLGKRGYLESLHYAHDREQGGKAIIEHADVKRMLLQQKAYAEGALALCLYAAHLHDKSTAGDGQSAALLDVSTEIVKSWPSEWCLEANKQAIQVLGGCACCALRVCALRVCAHPSRATPCHMCPSASQPLACPLLLPAHPRAALATCTTILWSSSIGTIA